MNGLLLETLASVKYPTTAAKPLEAVLYLVQAYSPLDTSAATPKAPNDIADHCAAVVYISIHESCTGEV